MAASSQTWQTLQQSKKSRQHRPVKELPTQLLEHCSVCLGEELWSPAFAILSSALTSGTGSSRPAYVPPVQHLALAATLIVHPQVTTRTNKPDKHAGADDALQYLRHAVSIAGVSNSQLDKAFCFTQAQQTTSRDKRAKTRVSGRPSDEDYLNPARTGSDYADKESLWSNADDFWSVVGWIFNCSVTHRRRWRRWKLWLELMLDVLEADLQDHADTQTVATSMMASYLKPVGEGRNNKRRLMRAILADGKQKSTAEFHEIWPNETKLPKKEDENAFLGKKRKLDIDNNEFGDYFDDDSDEQSLAASARRSRSATAAPSTKQSRQVSEDEDGIDDGDTIATTLTQAPGSSGLESFGGIDSIHLRQRLLALVLRFCSLEPSVFLDTEEFFDLCTEFLRPLPIAIFQQFVSPSKRYLDAHSQSSLDQMLLRPLLASTAPSYDANALTQADFETHYAPYAANVTSVIDNAKVGLLVEDLLRLLWRDGSLMYSEQLRELIEKGIKARKERVSMDGRRKTGSKALEDEEAGMVMESSAQRMVGLCGLLRGGA